MQLYFVSMALTVLANITYHVCQRSIDAKINPFVSLTVTYLVALVMSLLILPFVSERGYALEQFKQANWASYVLGAGIIGLELGFLLAYRAGWNLSVAA